MWFLNQSLNSSLTRSLTQSQSLDLQFRTSDFQKIVGAMGDIDIEAGRGAPVDDYWREPGPSEQYGAEEAGEEQRVAAEEDEEEREPAPQPPGCVVARGRGRAPRPALSTALPAGRGPRCHLPRGVAIRLLGPGPRLRRVNPNPRHCTYLSLSAMWPPMAPSAISLAPEQTNAGRRPLSPFFLVSLSLSLACE